MLGITAILNHAYRQHPMPLVHLETERSRAGFWGKPSLEYQTVAEACRGKAFLNFDDDAFGPGLKRFLAQQFPRPSRYDGGTADPTTPPSAALQSVIEIGYWPGRTYPPVAINNRPTGQTAHADTDRER
jgi:hypothetical protein